MKQRGSAAKAPVPNPASVAADHEETKKAAAAGGAAPKSSRWQSWAVRTPPTLAMILGFFGVIYIGHSLCVMLVIVLIGNVFKEVIAIARSSKSSDPEESTPKISLKLNWYLFAVATYMLFGRELIFTFNDDLMANPITAFLAHYHNFISVSLYMLGIMMFVWSLETGKYKKQLVQLAWSHMIIFCAVLPGHLWIYNIWSGLFWLLLPASLVINNDIWAFVAGSLFGRTPLIQLSPKKTWEGFIGGAIMTTVWAFFFSKALASYSWLICPKEHLYKWDVQCVPDEVFLPHEYLLPAWFAAATGMNSLTLLPVQLHALALSAFSSLVAPFGGFFASAVKRAFKLKDFGDLIPGHGGFTDRFDCQFLMGPFTYVYLTTFVLRPDRISSIMERIVKLSPEQQLEVFNRLRDFLINTGQKIMN